jgi:outer membrane lipopolysaccharide assembly protein LptE/RlpB
MRSGLLCLVIILLLVTGCGYHLPGRGSLPLEIQTVHVEHFGNATLEPFLERDVTTAVVDRLARSRLLDIVAQAPVADAVLSGTVLSYGSAPSSYDRNDIVREFRAIMTIEATLRRSADARVLWRGKVSWSENYPASTDKTMQYSREIEARRVISDRIASELLVRIAEDF